MRLLHLADLHLRWFDEVRARARDFDLLIITGDLTDPLNDMGRTQQFEETAAWLLSLETPTIVVSGYHDYYKSDDEADENGEARWLRRLSGQGRIAAVDGQVVEVPGTPRSVTVAAVGLDQAPQWPDATDVVVSHLPPCDCDCAAKSDGRQFHGSMALCVHLSDRNTPRPRLVLSGSTHAPLRAWSRWPADSNTPGTTILVPGRNESATEPPRWEIDLEKGRAAYFGEDEYIITI